MLLCRGAMTIPGAARPTFPLLPPPLISVPGGIDRQWQRWLRRRLEVYPAKEEKGRLKKRVMSEPLRVNFRAFLSPLPPPGQQQSKAVLLGGTLRLG